MTFPTATSRRRRSWLFSVLACLALTAQIFVAIAPLAEGRQGRSMSAHVESGTTKGHYTHDDATCISCQARSIHGTAEKPQVAIAYAAPVSAPVVPLVDRLIAGAFSPQTNPRAPPSVI